MFNIFSKEGLMSFIYTLPALLICLAVHEFAHAYTAYKLGDKSQKALGRLTLDPFKHIDWMGFLCIALCGFGWGKPVSVNSRSFKNESKGIMLTSLAGPLSNLLLAIFFTIVLKILIVTGAVGPLISTSAGGILTQMLLLTIQFNVVFAVFNMIPLPPFDGSKVLRHFLPYKAKQSFDMLERYSFIIIVIFFISGIGNYIILPLVNLILQGLMFIL
ncbi:MAG: site-2 protease family protein [Clostridia bacterium]|nr:site-2 protease family protein [Clostridia bacterium]